MSFGYDPEVPAGYQDADIEMAEAIEEGNRAARLRKAGKCTHGWRQGYNAGTTPHLSPGQAECHDCGRIATETALDDERVALGFGPMNF